MLCLLLMFPLVILAIKKWQDKDFVTLEMLYTYDGHAQQTTIVGAEQDLEQGTTEETEGLMTIVTEEPMPTTITETEISLPKLNLPDDISDEQEQQLQDIPRLRPPPSPSPSLDSGVGEGEMYNSNNSSSNRLWLRSNSDSNNSSNSNTLRPNVSTMSLEEVLSVAPSSGTPTTRREFGAFSDGWSSIDLR